MVISNECITYLSIDTINIYLPGNNRTSSTQLLNWFIELNQPIMVYLQQVSTLANILQSFITPTQVIQTAYTCTLMYISETYTHVQLTCSE